MQGATSQSAPSTDRCSAHQSRGYNSRTPKFPGKARSMDLKRGYPDLHEHLRKLESLGLLLRIDRAIDKDAELHPLVRWQFVGGIEEHERKAFLFTNVIDGLGRKYEFPVVVGALAANRAIYCAGMQAAEDQVASRWENAI